MPRAVNIGSGYELNARLTLGALMSRVAMAATNRPNDVMLPTVTRPQRGSCRA